MRGDWKLWRKRVKQYCERRFIFQWNGITFHKYYFQVPCNIIPLAKSDASAISCLPEQSITSISTGICQDGSMFMMRGCFLPLASEKMRKVAFRVIFCLAHDSFSSPLEEPSSGATEYCKRGGEWNGCPLKGCVWYWTAECLIYNSVKIP